MSSKINYRAIDVPTGKDPEDYTYAERRAEILEVIEGAGSPRLVNGAALARRYGCSRQNVYNDLDKLAEWADDTLGDREALEGEALLWRCIDGLLDEEDWKGAASVFTDLAEWRRQGDLEELLDRVESLEEVQQDGERRPEDNPFRVK